MRKASTAEKKRSTIAMKEEPTQQKKVKAKQPSEQAGQPKPGMKRAYYIEYYLRDTPRDPFSKDVAEMEANKHKCYDGREFIFPKQRMVGAVKEFRDSCGYGEVVKVQSSREFFQALREVQDEVEESDERVHSEDPFEENVLRDCNFTWSLVVLYKHGSLQRRCGRVPIG